MVLWKRGAKMKIKIFIENKIKSEFVKDATSEYMKRISKFAKVEFLPINKYSGTDAIKISHTGSDIDSPGLSNLFIDTMMNSSDINFILTDDNTYPSSYDIKLTSLTLSPDVEVTLLLEQIYRAFKIMNNETYHK